jgi:hypothetical protein
MKQVQNKTLESEEGIFNRSIKNKTLVEFSGQTVPAAEYFPVWLNNLADDVTLEGSLLNGFVQGSEAVRAIVTCIRKIYEHQTFSFAGPFGENLFFENYTGWVQGEPIGCIVMVIRNAAGQAQHIAASYRPLNTALLLSLLVREYLDDTPYSEYFVDKKFDSFINNI